MYADNWQRAVVMYGFLKGKGGKTRSDDFPSAIRIAVFRAAVGNEANEILNDQGFEDHLRNDTEEQGAVERALDILERHYCRESEAQKSFRYLGASQLEGESITKYLTRMTKLARRADMHRAGDRVLRAVYGLADSDLQRRLLIKIKEAEEEGDVIDWDGLTSYVRIHCAVDEVTKPTRPVTGKDQATGLSEGTTKPTVVTTQPTVVGAEPGGNPAVVSRAGDDSRQIDARPRSDSRDRGRDRDQGFRDRSYRGDSRPRDYSSDRYGRPQRREYDNRDRDREASPYRQGRYESRDRYDRNDRDTRSSYRYRSPSADRPYGRRGDDSDPRRVRFRGDNNRSSAPRSRSVTCDLCGEQGHYMRRCPDIQCKKCNGRGHVMSDCTRSDRRSQARAVSEDQVVRLVDRTEGIMLNTDTDDSD